MELTDGSIEYRNAGHLLVLGIPFVGSERSEAFEKLRFELQTMPEDYELRLKEHVQLHKKKYRSSEVVLADKGFDRSNERFLLDAYEGKLSNAMLEKLWRYGKYLFICSTGEEELPMPLYGLWHGEYDAIWSHNMANINIQMIATSEIRITVLVSKKDALTAMNAVHDAFGLSD